MKIFILVIIILLLSNCGYKPVRYDDATEACNTMYSTMRLVGNAKKELSMVDDTIEECIKSVTQKEKECLNLIYKKGVIKKGNFKKYKQYRQCLKGEEIEDET